MSIMYYTYVLKSEKDGKFYTGYSKDLKLRFEEYRKGRVESTKDRRPLELVYYEACLNQHLTDIEIRKEDDIDYAVFLVKQVYDRFYK